jgi:hypothetical protein
MKKHYNNCKLFDTNACPHKDNEDLIAIRKLVGRQPHHSDFRGDEPKKAEAICRICDSFESF